MSIYLNTTEALTYCGDLQEELIRVFTQEVTKTFTQGIILGVLLTLGGVFMAVKYREMMKNKKLSEFTQEDEDEQENKK